MITLFVGRFQPFHKGHLHDIKKALEFSDKVIIGIGSSRKNNTDKNPLTFEERRDMIIKVLEANNLTSCEIVDIPDIHDDSRWVDHVRSIVKEFDVVYTGNGWVKKLFEEKGYAIRDVTLIEGINATEIRKRMNNGESWKELVPDQVAEYLERIDGVRRIREINGAD